MSREKGYLQTISCNISLSSCRVRAESIARALNSRLWSRPVFALDRHNASGDYERVLASAGARATSCSGMANVINKPPHAMEVFKTAEGYEIGHCWINEMAAEDDESYNTPPCSSPPSPADDEIIVNPPSAFPFCAFLKDITSNAESKGKSKVSKNNSVLSGGDKLRDKLQKYADSLILMDDGSDTFYDATDLDTKEEELKHDVRDLEGVSFNCSQMKKECERASETKENGSPEEKVTTVSDDYEQKCDAAILLNQEPQAVVLIEVHPPAAVAEEGLSITNDVRSSRCLIVDRRLREVQELEEEDRPKLLRSTSLKTGKTPPGTPSRKKIVRFADVLGLDLEAVRHIVSDDLPNVPSSAFDDLNLPPEKESPHTKPADEKTTKWGSVRTVSSTTTALCGLYPMFKVPSCDHDFFSRVRKDWIRLESITISLLSVHCVCRVLNLTYEKQITARYTTNDWKTWDEVLASYVPFSSDGEFDKFSFSLYMKPGTTEDKYLSFALRYSAGKAIRWDNNDGKNYKLRYTGSEGKKNLILPSNDVLDPWIHHFC